mgnify:CR=1 FL=1
MSRRLFWLSVLAVLAGIVAAMAVGALLAWCLMCPDCQPVTKAEWEAQLAAQGIGGAE